MKGWECPRCHRCYAPFVRECSNCVGGTSLPDYEKLKDNPGEIQIGQNYQYGKCLVCHGYHAQGLACPTWTVTSEGE